MDLFNRDHLGQLLQTRGGICLSFYLSTHRAGKEVLQAPIRLKNLLKTAETDLANWIPRGAETQRLLQPVLDLVDDRNFWRFQSDGLAAFLSERGVITYRLPMAFADRVVVSDHFYVKPLLPLLSEDGRFYLLALSQKAVRLFLATRDVIESVLLEGVPTSLKEALKYDDMELQQLYRPTAGRSSAASGAYYGTSIGVEESKSEVRRFLKQVDTGVRAIMQGEQRPLLLAGVEPLVALYRESAYPHVMEPFLSGNPDDQSEQELHRRAWAIMAPHFLAGQHQAAAQFESMAGTGRASADLSEVLRAAEEGRVDRLFVAREADQWGRFDAATGKLTVHPAQEPGDEALLDRAAAQTLLHQGTVYAVAGVEIPKGAGGSAVAAIYRF